MCCLSPLKGKIVDAQCQPLRVRLCGALRRTSELCGGLGAAAGLVQLLLRPAQVAAELGCLPCSLSTMSLRPPVPQSPLFLSMSLALALALALALVLALALALAKCDFMG
jgi:hypothetical protein